MTRVRGVWIALLLASAAACSGTKAAAPKRTLGESCSTDEDCASELFCPFVSYAGHCTSRCAITADCPDAPYWECGVLADGSRACLPECYLSSALSGFACVDGVPTSCAVVGDEECASCGCDPGLTCLAGTGCIPPSDVGGPCDSDDDCLSNNCSSFAGVCRVPEGTACSPANCDYCLSGWYCSRQCRSTTDCKEGRCLGEIDGTGQFTGLYFCRPSCSGPTASSPCPGECEYHTDAQYYYCDCDFSTCVGTHAPRAIGQRCLDSEWCTPPATCRFTGTNTGFCTAPCTSAADCGASGLACTPFDPCAPGASCSGICRQLCDTSSDCDVGICNQRPDTTGTPMGVCE